MDNEKLIDMAKKASKSAYVPYSGYKLGAALLCENGEVFTGCNVENASYPLTICAERNAIFQAVAKGNKDFVKIAIYVDSEEFFPPCGACRQVMSEFSDKMEIIISNHDKTVVSSIDKLLPMSFGLDK